MAHLPEGHSNKMQENSRTAQDGCIPHGSTVPIQPTFLVKFARPLALRIMRLMVASNLLFVASLRSHPRLPKAKADETWRTHLSHRAPSDMHLDVGQDPWAWWNAGQALLMRRSYYGGPPITMLIPNRGGALKAPQMHFVLRDPESTLLYRCVDHPCLCIHFLQASGDKTTQMGCGKVSWMPMLGGMGARGPAPTTAAGLVTRSSCFHISTRGPNITHHAFPLQRHVGRILASADAEVDPRKIYDAAPTQRGRRASFKAAHAVPKRMVPDVSPQPIRNYARESPISRCRSTKGRGGMTNRWRSDLIPNACAVIAFGSLFLRPLSGARDMRRNCQTNYYPLSALHTIVASAKMRMHLGHKACKTSRGAPSGPGAIPLRRLTV